MDWYFLLNEEENYEPHYVLGTPDPNRLHGSGVTVRSVAFTVPSPVQTVDGIHAATFVNKACLWVCHSTLLLDDDVA